MHHTFVRRFDLRLDLETREQRQLIAVELEPRHLRRHHALHVLARLFVDLLAVDDHLADIRTQVVAQRAQDDVVLLIDQKRRAALLGGLFNGGPDLAEIIGIPLQFLGRAADAVRTHDHAHRRRDLQLFQRGLGLLALLAFGATRDAAGLGVVRHQHQIAAGERDERGQGRALAAALLLFDLDDQFLAFAEEFLDLARRLLEVALVDFLEWQKAMPLAAIVDEAGFEALLDACDPTLVNVGLLLLPAGQLDVEIDELLPVDDCHAQFFALCGIDEDAFHFCAVVSAVRSTARRGLDSYARRMRFRHLPSAAGTLSI